MSTHSMPRLTTRRRLGAVACALLLISLTSCFSFDPKTGVGNGFAYLTDVRSAGHSDSDRVVIEFAADKLPDWDVRQAAPPFRFDGSGGVVKVQGHAYLSVRLNHADAHTFFINKSRFSPPGTPNITEVVSTGDFEGHVGYIIGLENARKFDVTVLKSPSRLVIDVQH